MEGVTTSTKRRGLQLGKGFSAFSKNKALFQKKAILIQPRCKLSCLVQLHSVNAVAFEFIRTKKPVDVMIGFYPLSKTGKERNNLPHQQKC